MPRPSDDESLFDHIIFCRRRFYFIGANKRHCDRDGTHAGPATDEFTARIVGDEHTGGNKRPARININERHGGDKRPGCFQTGA